MTVRPPTPQDVVAKRFCAADLENPVQAMLYGLALEREAARPNPTPPLDMDLDGLPDAEELISLRTQNSLLPLESVKDRVKLPALPATVFQLQRAVDEGASADRLAELIQNDPKLATAVLSLANSPLYAMTSRVETLRRAVTVIGARALSSLALATRLLSMFEDSMPEGLPVVHFWRHSIACAVLAFDIATLAGRPEPERHLVAGLLHDLGRVILFSHSPRLCKTAMAYQRTKNMSLREAELRLFDVDHCMIGGLFFNDWNMPRSVTHAALYHHEPDKCLGKDVPEVVYVANQIATALGLGCNAIYAMEPGEAVWAALGLDETTLRPLVENAEDRMEGTFHSLFPSRPRRRP